MKIKKQTPDFLEQLDYFEQKNEEVKFDLFVQTRRVKQILTALTQILQHKIDSEVENWIGHNSEVIDQLLEDLLDDSLLVLDGVELDDESKSLSMELMSNIKETVHIINALISKDQVQN